MKKLTTTEKKMNERQNIQTCQLNSFCRLIETLENGELHSDLTNTLDSIIKEMDDHLLAHHMQSKATLKLELNFTHDRDGTVKIQAKVDKKLPASPRCPTFTWIGGGNKLQRTDPNQENLFNIKSIEDSQKTVKVI